VTTSVTDPAVRRVHTPPTDFRRTLAVLRIGAHDPCSRIGADGWWWATRSPEGPVTVHLAVTGADEVLVSAWGAGRAWALEHAPALAGACDRPDERPMEPAWLRVLQRRFADVRLPATHRVVDAALVAVLGQRVTGVEARRSWAGLVRLSAERAPGPCPLLLPPDPSRLASLPYWSLHPLGVDRRRAETIRTIAAASERLERAGADVEILTAALLTIRGVGPWTVAETTALALGDADALPVGDYHAKHIVRFAFTGEPRGTDEEMLELLAPYAGQRRRVLRWLELAGAGPPRVAPRQRIAPIAAW
jgi:3-methyladenine DNA glycosylase/8-oxoguanine DNA glycosylase